MQTLLTAKEPTICPLILASTWQTAKTLGRAIGEVLRSAVVSLHIGCVTMCRSHQHTRAHRQPTRPLVVFRIPPCPPGCSQFRKTLWRWRRASQLECKAREANKARRVYIEALLPVPRALRCLVPLEAQLSIDLSLNPLCSREHSSRGQAV